MVSDPLCMLEGELALAQHMAALVIPPHTLEAIVLSN